MLHEVRFNVFYTNRKVNTPTGNFWQNWQLTIVCGHRLNMSPHTLRQMEQEELHQ